MNQEPRVPTVDVVTTPLAESTAALVAVGVFAPESGERDDPPELSDAATQLADAMGIDLATELVAAGFEASAGKTLRVPTRGAIPSPSLLVIGLGKRASATADHLRRAAAVAVGAAERLPSLATSLHATLDGIDPALAAQAVAEGIHLGAYRFTSYRTDPPPFDLTEVTLHADAPADGADDSGADHLDEVRAGVEVAAVTAGAALLVRELVNTPPQDKRPPVLAERVATEVADLPIAVRILDEEALAEGGYGGILGVGQGSSEPPRLVELTYDPPEAGGHVALVGKGITFDTGGLSLKPSSAMETMKMDMGGAAVVLAVIKGAAQLGLPVKLTGVLALAENMPSGTATRVSDVLTMRGGTTVEVINTDAEGRLVLGDALAHASELEPDVIVDIATLTGAVVIALGDRIGALLASDDELAEALLAAADGAGEPHWRLPLAREQYGERVEGTIADLKNHGGREAGSIWAALFLDKFVGDGIAWAHLDIAGVAWTDEASGYRSKGATGVPVRTLLAWLQAR